MTLRPGLLWGPVLAVLLALLALLALAPAPAQACSCVTPPLTRQELPAEGSQGFPTDGWLRVHLEGPWPVALREELGREYRLRGPDGELLALHARLAGTVVELKPAQPLRPGADFTLERAFPYLDGRLLTDEQRWQRVSGRHRVDGVFQPPTAEGITLRWHPVRHFTTGPGPEARAPSPPRITGARAGVRRGGGDCGPGEAVTVELELPADLVETDLVALELRGQGIVGHQPARPPPSPGAPAGPGRLQVGDLLCTSDKVHVELRRGTAQVRAVLMTAAGRVVAEGGWTPARVPAEAEEREPKPHPADPEPGEATRAAVARWRAPPVDEEPRAAAAGPASCPHGLELVDRALLAEAEWPQSKRALLGPGGAWLLVEEEGRALSARALSGEAPILPPLDPHSRLVAADPDLLLLDRPALGDGDPGLFLSLLDAAGQPRWRQELVAPGDEGAPDFWAAGPDRVLVGWTWWEPGLVRHQAWSLRDRRGGSPVAGGAMADFAPEGRHVDAVAWSEGRFVLAWSWARPNLPREPEVGPADLPEGRYLTWLHPNGGLGPTVPQPEALGRVVALLPTARGLVALGSRDGDLALGWLSAQGALARGPVRVNPGAPSGGSPSLAEWRGLVAVLWNASPDGAWVTVVDADAGLAARPLRLGQPRALAAALRADADRLTVGFGEAHHRPGRWSPVVGALRCRLSPMPGPPPLLAPPTPAPPDPAGQALPGSRIP